MRLGAKLRLSYVGIVLVAVSIVLILIVASANRELKEKIGEDLQYVAKMEAETVDEYIKKKIYETRILSQDSLFRAKDTAAMADYLKKVAEEDIGFDVISVVDPEGKIIASTNSQFAGRPFTAHDNELVEFFKKATTAEKGNVFFKYGYGGKNRKELKAFIFTPITGESKTDVISVMMATVNMDRVLRDTDRPEGHTFGGKIAYLVDNKATMIVTQEGKARTFRPLVYVQNEDSPLKDFIKRDKGGYTTYKDLDGTREMVGYANLGWYGKVKGRPWLVISMAPQKEVFSPAIRLRNTMIVVAIIAVLIAWILSIFVAQGITKPLRKLVNVTYLIAKGDFSQRADIKLDDEVGDLARSFNKMTDELNSAIASRDEEIIERRNIEEKLKEEMESKAQFISMISNEFKPSLTTIREGISIVLKELSEKLSEKQKGILELTRKSGANLAHLIRDIVDFHRLETDKTEFNITENDINEIVAEVQKSMVPLLAEKKEVELVVNADGKLPKAKFDKDKISLVLTNIMNIAIKSTEEGTVTVATAKEGDNAIRVSVKDNGPWIKKADLKKIFEKSEDTGKAKDKEAGGTGLGLIISKEIIERHKGKIWAESEEGEGTTFNFVIPIKEREPQKEVFPFSEPV
ncbi:MAG: sensor histidine kinase [Candidatus Omnitrophota bacterium]